MDTEETIYIILGSLILLGAFITVPHLFIAAINILFATSIAHTFTNWVAALILITLVQLIPITF